MKIIFLCVLQQFLLASCIEKRGIEVQKLDFEYFVKSSNKILQENSYFSITNIRLTIPIKDTALLSTTPVNAKNKYASSVSEIMLDGRKSELNIEYYGNLSKKDKAFLEEEFMIERKLEGISCIIKLDTFFCKVWLNDDLPSTKYYLQNVKIVLLENYIEKTSD